MVATAYVEFLSSKFKKDPSSSCGEIDVLLALDNSLKKPEKTKGSVKKIREGRINAPKSVWQFLSTRYDLNFDWKL